VDAAVMRALASCVVFVLWAAPCFAQDAQSRAEAMLDRARAVSDIRDKDATAFRLKLEFTFPGNDLEQKQGTYTEWWASKDKWRREIVVGSDRRIEIGEPNTIFWSDVGEELPEQVRRLPGLVDPVPPRNRKTMFESVISPVAEDANVECAVTVPSSSKQKGAFCFHKPSGVLIQKLEPYPVGRRITAYRCDFAAFQIFGSHTYPRQMVCLVEGHKKIEAKVVELSLQASLDANLFNPPADAVEINLCTGKQEPPKTTSAEFPSLPESESLVSIGMEFVVDAQGNARNVRITRSGGAAFDTPLARAVQKWRFAPAKCDGRRISTKIAIEIPVTPP
jgi:TonB family protein